MSYKSRCMRAELRRCLRQLLTAGSTEVWKEASAWGSGYTVKFNLEALCANLTVSLSHIDDEDHAEYITTVRLLPRVIKTLWREIQDSQKVMEANRRFWRVANKLSK